MSKKKKATGKPRRRQAGEREHVRQAVARARIERGLGRRAAVVVADFRRSKGRRL